MNKKMYLYMVLAIFSLISFVIVSQFNDVQADHHTNHVMDERSHIVKLNDQMVKLYELSKQANKIAAYNQAQTVKLHIQKNDATFKAQFEHWHAFEEELALLENQLVSKSNSLQWKETINRLFLASDAMLQGDDGPWREYEVLLLDRIRLMESSFINQSTYRSTAMQANLTILDEQLNRVALAAMLVGNSTRLAELQFRVIDMKAFMLTLSTDTEQLQNYRELEQSIAAIKQTTLALFENTTSVSIEPIIESKHFPIQVALLLTLLLTLILTFTSYRKYKQTPYGVKKYNS